MNKELAEILANKINELPFIDVLAGLAQPVTYTNQRGDGTDETRRIPVSYDTNIAGNAEATPERVLMPDSSKKSIIYFEDYGISAGRARGRWDTFTSRLRLVCWYNKENLLQGGQTYQNTNAEMIAAILAELRKGTPFNYEKFRRIYFGMPSLPIADAGLFNRYTYDEQVRQYLRPPFDFFAIDLAVNFEINSKC